MLSQSMRQDRDRQVSRTAAEREGSKVKGDATSVGKRGKRELARVTAGEERSAELFGTMLRRLAMRRRAEDYLHASSKNELGDDVPSPPASLFKDIAERHECGFVSEGSCRIFVPPDQTFHMMPGRLIVIDPGVEHHELPDDPPVPYVFWWFHFTRTRAAMTYSVFERPNHWRVGPWMEMNGFTDVENVAAVLAAELSARRWGWLPSVRGLLRYLTAVLVRRVQRGSSVHPRQSESPTIRADPRTWHVISTALDFCGANFRRPLRAVDVAGAVGYSPSHLCHMISSHLGHTLHEHIRGLRVNAAKQLLESSELSIGEIAHHVGYGLPHHFSRAFKQTTGISPTAYREQHRGA